MSVPFAEQVQQLIDARDALDVDAVRRVVSLLELLHERVMAQLAGRPDLALTDVRQLRAEIEGLIRQFEAQAVAEVAGYQQQAWDLADTAIASQMATAGIRTGIVGVSTETLNILQGYSATQIKGLSAEALRRINTELQLAGLGGRSFTELVTNIGRNLDSPSTFGTIRARAETIARTEVGRVYEIGSTVRGNQTAEVLPGLQKTWLHATGQMPVGKLPKGMYRPRAAHVALHRVTIPWEEKFNVDGFEADGPMDPTLPASQVVNCKCTKILDFSALDDVTLRVA